MKRAVLDERIKANMENSLHPIPDEVRRRIDDTLNRLPHDPTHERRHRLRMGKAAAGFVACLLLAFSIIALSKSTFADAIKPWVHSIFSWMGDRGLASGKNDSGGTVLPVLAQKEDQGYILKIHETRFDGMRLSLSYSLEKKDNVMSKDVHVIPDFKLDATIKQLDPAVLKSDSGGVLNQGKAGIVNYFFQGKLPEKFKLLVHVPALGVMDTSTDAAGQQTVQGNWDFAVDIQQTGNGVASEIYQESAARDFQQVRFNVVQARFSDTASEWKLHWEIPQSMIAANQKAEKTFYGIKYLIKAEGQPLNIVTSLDSSRIKDRKLPEDQWSQLKDARLYAEPIPKEAKKVIIVPVLMKFPVHPEDGDYTEQELDQLAVEVAVNRN
ncbi:DUF4179 domain-containing protein [Paenibacillus donghaensis]|uniref:DUF4179 domain-containing protein n=1 Tax=Paenibacillus donghaensis TaxID=414771 RepID=UPI001883EB57|nr:DUF4179 domain-containing protein [Paenibacillus donghaensis]MBE9918068.1 DUF4179 domain-containing protein [Paenibacillus donghaensis]